MTVEAQDLVAYFDLLVYQAANGRWFAESPGLNGRYDSSRISPDNAVFGCVTSVLYNSNE